MTAATFKSILRSEKQKQNKDFNARLYDLSDKLIRTYVQAFVDYLLAEELIEDPSVLPELDSLLESISEYVDVNKIN